MKLLTILAAATVLFFASCRKEEMLPEIAGSVQLIKDGKVVEFTNTLDHSFDVGDTVMISTSEAMSMSWPADQPEPSRFSIPNLVAATIFEDSTFPSQQNPNLMIHQQVGIVTAKY